MPAPTSLGLVATGAVYSPWNSGSIVSPLELTTLVDVPASTPRHPVALMLLLRVAPRLDAAENTIPFGFDAADITDDAPGPGDANVYTGSNPDGDGGFAYNFGRPTFSCFPDFDIGNDGSLQFHSGQSACVMVYCFPSRTMPAGTTITVPFTLGGTDEALVSATVLAFVDGNTPIVQLSSRTINPAIVTDGNSANVPLGDHLLSELFSGIEQLVAHVWADDAGTSSGPAISGAETIDDISTGVWTKIDSGGYATTSDQGGLVYSVFVADASAIDLTQPLVSFEISDGIGVDDGTGGSATPAAGVAIYRTQYAVRPPEGSPAFNRVIPV